MVHDLTDNKGDLLIHMKHTELNMKKGLSWWERLLKFLKISPFSLM
jgi:hypothetical protein